MTFSADNKTVILFVYTVYALEIVDFYLLFTFGFNSFHTLYIGIRIATRTIAMAVNIDTLVFAVL
jgi:hypothetical protein